MLYKLFALSWENNNISSDIIKSLNSLQIHCESNKHKEPFQFDYIEGLFRLNWTSN